MGSVTNRQLLSAVIWLAGLSTVLAMAMFVTSRGEASQLRSLTNETSRLRRDLEELRRQPVASREPSWGGIVPSIVALEASRSRLELELRSSEAGLASWGTAEVGADEVVVAWRESLGRLQAEEARLREELTRLEDALRATSGSP